MVCLEDQFGNGTNQESNPTENKQEKSLHVLGKSGSGTANEDTLLLDLSSFKSKDLGLDYNGGLKTSPMFAGSSAKNLQTNIKEQINIMASDIQKQNIHASPTFNRKTPDIDTTDLPLKVEDILEKRERGTDKKYSFGPMQPTPECPSQEPKLVSPEPKPMPRPLDPTDFTPENARPKVHYQVGSNEHIDQIDTPKLEAKLTSNPNSLTKGDLEIDPINGFEPNQDFFNEKIKLNADTDGRRGSRSKTFSEFGVPPSCSDLGLTKQESDSFFGLQNEFKKLTDDHGAENEFCDGNSTKLAIEQPVSGARSRTDSGTIVARKKSLSLVSNENSVCEGCGIHPIIRTDYYCGACEIYICKSCYLWQNYNHPDTHNFTQISPIKEKSCNTANGVIECEICGTGPITTSRYSCEDCDHNLCDSCYHQEKSEHETGHT